MLKEMIGGCFWGCSWDVAKFIRSPRPIVITFEDINIFVLLQWYPNVHYGRPHLQVDQGILKLAIFRAITQGRVCHTKVKTREKYMHWVMLSAPHYMTSPL